MSDISKNPQNRVPNGTEGEGNCENALNEHGDGQISTEKEVVAGSSSATLTVNVMVAAYSGGMRRCYSMLYVQQKLFL